MRRGTWAVSFALALVCLALFPSPAHAQSAIAGSIKDASGAVLPGVTVEAASAALIEKTRTVVSDQVGQYKIVDLRPGIYTVTFSLPGFSTVRREAIELPANFTLPLNADLRVGALEETVTVAGASPVVDVQNTSKNQVINRDALDALPTGRSLHAIGELVVGVSMSRPDVGGSASMQQTYMSIHGLTQQQNTVEVDGINAAQTQLDGTNPFYFPQAYIQEMVYQTSSVSPDATGGGIRANAVPKDGGNSFSGSLFVAGFPGSFVSNNLTQALRNQGLGGPNQVTRSYDFEASVGGPLKRDKLWFFANPRFFGVDDLVAGTYICDGCYGKATAPTSGPLGLDSQFVIPLYGRLTWQASPRNKFAGYFNWNFKDRDGQMTAGTDPITARQDFTYLGHVAYVSAVKWTSTLSNRLLLEVGFDPNILTWTNDPRPHSGILEYGSTAWLNTPQKVDLDLGTTWNSAVSLLNNPVRYYTRGSISYITGSHSLKLGGIYDFGHFRMGAGDNADLIAQFRSGVPSSVAVQNTPRQLNDIYRITALFAQDVWILKRLTLSPGVRWEYLNGGNAAQTVPAGRFVPARSFPRVDDLPNWKTISPRLGAAYDLFGTAKTALKFSLNRYDLQRLTSFANAYNPLGGTNQSTTLAWTDLNGDTLPQGDRGCTYLTTGCEINFAQLPANFGVRTLNTPDPDIKRPYLLETSVGVQHELVPRVSISGTWLRNVLKNAIYSYNSLLTYSDWSPVNVVSPLDGSLLTLYNLDRSKLGQVANVDATDPGGRQTYNSYEFNVNARLPGGGTFFGGSSTERAIQKKCDQPDNPNTLLFCDQGVGNLPWRTQFKLNGSYPLPWGGVQVSAAFQSYAPTFLPISTGGATFDLAAMRGSVSWLISPTTRYASNCVGPCTPGALVIPNMTQASLVVPLTPGNSQTNVTRTNQLDLSVSKGFTIRRMRIRGRFDVFNSLNTSAVQTARSSNFGTPAFAQPATILDGRTIRLGVQASF